jgi:uncharacterized protein (TIGR00251 family)
MKTWINQKDEGILLNTYIQPGASRNEFAGEYGDPIRLKIKIKSPPVDGAANTELIKFISKSLKISKSQIHLVRGDTSRNKDLYLENTGQECLEIVRIINNLTKLKEFK